MSKMFSSYGKAIEGNFKWQFDWPSIGGEYNVIFEFKNAGQGDI